MTARRRETLSRDSTRAFALQPNPRGAAYALVSSRRVRRRGHGSALRNDGRRVERKVGVHDREGYYTATTLETALSRYEAEYGMTSAEFFEAHHSDDVEALREIPGFQRSVWSGLWQELQEFGSSSERASLPLTEPHGFRLAA